MVTLLRAEDIGTYGSQGGAIKGRRLDWTFLGSDAGVSLGITLPGGGGSYHPPAVSGETTGWWALLCAIVPP